MATGSCTHLRLNGIKESRKEEKKKNTHGCYFDYDLVFVYKERV